MTKRYALWQFKHWLPIFLVFCIFVVLGGLMTVMTGNLGHPAEGYYYETMGTSFLGCVIPALIASFIMPFLVYSYRTKRVYVDTFYQADLKEGSFRRVRLLLGLAFVIAPFIAAFITSMLVHIIRYVSTPDTYYVYSWLYSSEGVEYVKVAVNFLAYLPQFFLGVILLAASYSINCFLVSLGDYVLDQVFLLIFGTLVLALVVVGPAAYCMVILNATYSSIPLEISLEPIGEFVMAARFEQLFKCNEYWYGAELFVGTYDAGIIVDLLTTLLHLVGGVLAFLYCYKKKDPSGEYADSRGARTPFIAIIPHLGATVVGIFVAILVGISGSIGLFYVVGINFFWSIFEFLFFAAIYYCLLALWRHNWKASRMDLICYFAVLAVVFVLTITAASVRAVY